MTWLEVRALSELYAAESDILTYISGQFIDTVFKFHSVLDDLNLEYGTDI